MVKHRSPRKRMTFRHYIIVSEKGSLVGLTRAYDPESGPQLWICKGLGTASTTGSARTTAGPAEVGPRQRGR
jgi:hypothetical protein